MVMIIDQDYMEDEVIKPIKKRLDEIEKLIKTLDKSTKLKISWMSDNIAKLPKKRKK